MTPIIPPQFKRPAPIPQFHWSRIIIEAEVTDEMVKEAREIDAAFPNAGSSFEYFREIYRAMHSVAPVPLVSPAEDQLHGLKMIIRVLTEERDGFEIELKQRTDERDTANADLAELSAIRWGLIQQINDLQKELVIERMINVLRAKEATALQDALAKAITPTPQPKPDPIANAIRTRETDRRRIGGM